MLWPGRVWIVELKTERASHRSAQIPDYFDLAHHHHPGCAVDITYLTPPLLPAVEPPGPWGRFAHLTWAETVPLLHDAWGDTTDSAARVVLDGVLETIATMQLRPSEWRASYLVATAEESHPAEPTDDMTVAAPAERPTYSLPSDTLKSALELAEQTSRDGTQRALEFTAANLEELQQLRLEIRTAIRAAPDGSPLRHVMPWLWSTTSTGKPLTRAGVETGYELRLSRHTKPL